jgi:hypothetical protein
MHAAQTIEAEREKPPAQKRRVTFLTHGTWPMGYKRPMRPGLEARGVKRVRRFRVPAGRRAA